MSVTDLSLRKRLGLKLFKKYRHNQAKLHELNYIFWECTLRCNLHCLHCGSECKKEAGVKDMPAKDFLKAIDQIIDIVNPNTTTIVFTGGEPLVRKDLELVGLELYHRGFPWGIVSNGLLLNEKRLNSLLNSGMRAATISLDGFEESHNWLRGNPNSFSHAVNAISLLAKTPDLAFDVVTCANQKNFDELPKIKELLISLGVKEWRIFTIFPIGRAAEHPELQLPSDKFKQVFDFIAETRKEGRIKLNYGCEGFLGKYEQKVRDNFFYCKAGINVASVLVDGSIAACPDLRANFIQGNIYKDNFKDIWENKYQIFRDKSWAKTGVCADCNFFDYCEGNGMHLHNENTGELMFCHLKRIEEGENMTK